MKQVEMYTDGACRGNPGKGGFGTVIVYKGKEKVLTDGWIDTTNNRMELYAAIAGLEALKEPCKVKLYSDSKYLVDGMNKGWAESWRRNSWKKADKKPALNVDLWSRLLLLTERHEVEFIWVKGHDGHEYNERCDALATASADGAMKKESL
ncbi:MAG: ribonuclease HI [Ruminococcaceae bacterium]|nr:ribonuclease HI [Oscillospiraceae bacterium]